MLCVKEDMKIQFFYGEKKVLVGCDSTEISIVRIYFSIWGAKQLLETRLSECSKRHLQISNFLCVIGGFQSFVWGSVGFFT